MTTRNINFDDNGLSFLLLNIIGHDPIHDFGQPSDNRWHQVNKQINDIQPFILSNDDTYGKRQRDVGNDNTFVKNEGNNNNDKNQGNKKRRIKGGAVLNNSIVGFKYEPKPLMGVSTLTKDMVKPSIRPEVSRPEVSVPLPEVSRPEVSRPEVYEIDSYPDVNAVLNIISYVNDNNHHDSRIINNYFDDIKNRITMNLFVNDLNRKKYLLNNKAEYGSLRSICNSIIIPDVINEEKEKSLFIVLSRHLHDYIVSCFLLKIDEKQVLGIAFDSIMTEKSIIRIRYIKLDRFTLGNIKDTNTELINKNKEQHTVDFSVTEIMDTFFNSNYYFLHSLQKTFLVKKENNTNSVGNELRGGDTNNLDIEIVRGILNFKEGVFKDIPIITDKVTEQIQKIRNATYSYVMAAKGYEYDNNNNKITLIDMNNAFQKKKNTDKNEKEIRDLSAIMEMQKKMIISLYTESFKILKHNNFISNFKIIPTRFSTSRSMLRIDTEIDNELSLLFRDEIKFRKMFDDKIRKDKIEDDKRELALSAGSLTPGNKETANNFISFIAKSALYLTNCCDSSGSITKIDNGKKNDTNYNILIEEIDCIRNIAGRDGLNDYWSPTRGSKDIDHQLFSYIKDPSKGFINTDKPSFNENDLVIDKINKSNNKYVINNAANIRTLQRNTFCPYTSILDGMSQCSWGSDSTEEDNIERGDIDFKITSKIINSSFYNGVLNILPENKLNVGFHIKLDKIQISSIEGLDMNAKALVAHVVLRNTLNSILAYINDPSFTRERSELYAEKNIFVKLFQMGVGELQITNNNVSKNKSSHPGSIFTSLLKNLLFKGVGDIFQEINAICAFGGYDGNKYESGGNVIGYDKSKNAPRCFVAKDRVSVCRYLFIRKQGDPNEINETTSGGYIDGADNPSNTGVSYRIPQRGGSNPRTIVMKNNITLKKKNRIVLSDGKIIININLHKTKKNSNKNMTINLNI